EIRSREQIIFCGKEVITEVFKQLKSSAKFKNSKLDLQILAKDGDVVASGKSIARGVGDARLIFAAERVILNLVQHLSGVATLTNKFIKKLNNKKITILDTRKTLPGLRDPAKYAVKVGGGKNHRRDLSAMILIKDNHIAAAGSVSAVLLAAKKAKGKKVEIECDTLQQVVEAAESKPDVIMLDNMSVAQIRKSVELIRKVSKKIQIEISGGVRLSNIKKFSKLDVDYISIGALTHCAPAVDIGLDSK
ncbi:MAG: carboxylating nicotinate-nucleotide diphosphorylase, partial [Alphaproteobacteria bacterium]|nr:carboxylating nicotinate-nucleotide diphosphorylase [Alphaproteobacteria bacterium]